MATFVSLYPKPQDVDGWEEHFRTTHMPIIERWPGVQSVRVLRFSSTPRGSDAAFHVMAQADFATDEEMAAALRSEAGAEAARDAMAMAQKFGSTPAMMLGTDL
jgi:uncharacterized protein (TIGR02118 family)